MHRTLLAALFLMLPVLGCPALAQSGLQPAGTWRTPGGDAHVRIAKCGQAYCGTVTRILSGESRDVNNPDPALRGRSLVGVAISSDMRPSGEGWEGSLYNFRDGKTYSGKLAMKGPDALELAGCVFGGLICKRQVWSRVN
ncbi:DUF2147 domain-containing protein [Methylobacterium isbiliense]|uniref:DUF2147 domain-containing protein n=1 Tax=Methylobacterium isbiliense TaxID=315478 RepID=A0ABQ4SFK6_9HYPH|nr:DUF2147 domain-containing protein [Methylobacterium isbiliense]MDN3626425.1 DUF2147 domain-containing protein [Methylobacterium isbiliense]GJE02007.1 hypothetical protein GMJLKIPL_3951 [Methylobacterium isbiliense]